MSDPSPQALMARDALLMQWNIMRILLASTGVDAASPTVFWEKHAPEIIQNAIDQSHDDVSAVTRNTAAMVGVVAALRGLVDVTQPPIVNDSPRFAKAWKVASDALAQLDPLNGWKDDIYEEVINEPPADLDVHYGA